LQRLGNPGHALGPIMAPAGECSDPIAVASAHETVAVVLDLVDPKRPARHGATKRRDARFYEADGTTLGW
jgi:hypothetical protein